jgi:hypothetical protein
MHSQTQHATSGATQALTDRQVALILAGSLLSLWHEQHASGSSASVLLQERWLRAVLQRLYAVCAGAVGAAIYFPICFCTVADDSAAAMATGGGKRLDRTLKAIEDMRLVIHNNFESFVIVIAACFALCHGDTPPIDTPGTTDASRGSSYRQLLRRDFLSP